jgi:mannose/cellobiose epimerase-like protein (N-acyl-D-glucosamine 2-epimerase family)
VAAGRGADYPGLPHRDAAVALVKRVCQEFGDNVAVRVAEVPDQQAAEQARFLVLQPHLP